MSAKKNCILPTETAPFFRVKTDLFYLQCSTEILSEKKKELHEL